MKNIKYILTLFPLLIYTNICFAQFNKEFRDLTKIIGNAFDYETKKDDSCMNVLVIVSIELGKSGLVKSIEMPGNDFFMSNSLTDCFTAVKAKWQAKSMAGRKLLLPLKINLINESQNCILKKKEFHLIKLSQKKPEEVFLIPEILITYHLEKKK